MIFAPPDSIPATEFGKYGESVSRPIPHVVYATSAATRISHRLDIDYLPIDASGLILRLLEKPRLCMSGSGAGRVFQAEGWDVSCRLNEIPQLPLLLSRRFLELHSKAESASLSEYEEGVWLSVLDRVDIQSFSIDRALPHYSEGVVVRKNQRGVVVEWEDGESSNLPWAVAGGLYLLKIGETFSAYVKLGRDNIPSAIERVSLLENAA